MGILRQLGSTSGGGLGFVDLHLRRRHLGGDSIGGGLCVLGSEQGVADLCAGGVEFGLDLGMVQISSKGHPAGLAGVGELVDPDLDGLAVLAKPRVPKPGIGGMGGAVVVRVLPIRRGEGKPRYIFCLLGSGDGGFDLAGDGRELPGNTVKLYGEVCLAEGL